MKRSPKIDFSWAFVLETPFLNHFLITSFPKVHRILTQIFTVPPKKWSKKWSFWSFLDHFWTPSNPKMLRILGDLWQNPPKVVQKWSDKMSLWTHFLTTFLSKSIDIVPCLIQKVVQKWVQKWSKSGHFWSFLGHFWTTFLDLFIHHPL